MIILGAGRQAVETAAYCRSLGLEVTAYVEEFATGSHDDLDAPVTNFVDQTDELTGLPVVTAVGSARLRRRFVDAWKGTDYLTVKSPSALVDPGARVGIGTTVAPGAIVGRLVEVGRHVLINTGAILCHDVTVADFATVSPGCTLGGLVSVGVGAFIGIGATISDRIVIGDGATIGAGAVVIDDVAEGLTVVGVPARPIVRSAQS